MKAVDVFGKKYLLNIQAPASALMKLAIYLHINGRRGLVSALKQLTTMLLAPFIVRFAKENPIDRTILVFVNQVLEEKFGKLRTIEGFINGRNGYVGLAQAQQELFIIHARNISTLKPEHTNLGARNFEGLVSIAVPRLATWRQYENWHISVESCLPVPIIRAIGRPSADFFIRCWRNVLEMKGAPGFVHQSNILADVINPLEQRSMDAPKWLIEWLATKKWQNLSITIGVTIIGPVHGDLDIKNCWKYMGKLCVVDFERSLAKAPMLIDLIRWHVFGDLNQTQWEQRASAIIGSGLTWLPRLPELEAFNSELRIRRGLVFLTFLYEVVWGVKSDFSFSHPSMVRLLSFMRAHDDTQFTHA